MSSVLKTTIFLFLAAVISCVILAANLPAANVRHNGQPVLSTTNNIYYDVADLPSSIDLKVGQLLYFVRKRTPSPPSGTVRTLGGVMIHDNRTSPVDFVDFGVADEKSYRDMFSPQMITADGHPKYQSITALEAKHIGSGEIEVSVGKRSRKIKINVTG